MRIKSARLSGSDGFSPRCVALGNALKGRGTHANKAGEMGFPQSMALYRTHTRLEIVTSPLGKALRPFEGLSVVGWARVVVFPGIHADRPLRES
jgi:hypothetical protein